jgi:hypothetical protein
MNLFRSRAAHPVIVPAQFREAMSRPAVARELFLPTDCAWWDGGNYTLGRTRSRTNHPVTTGVRLQEPRSPSPGLLPERDTQQDLGALVESVAELRKVPELSGVVLSPETVVGKQTGTIRGKRVLFGLYCSGDDRFKSEEAAARECHRAIQVALRRAGYAVEHPTAPFDSTTGLSGLADWGRSVRLGRRKFDRRWLLLLLLPLLLWLPIRGCGPGRSAFSGIALQTDTVIILFDKSGSMDEYFAQIREDARSLLEERRQLPGEHFADLIVYDMRSASALKGLQPITPQNISKITDFVNSLRPGGKTNLGAAIDRAAEEVVRHGRKTTLLVFTDGEEDPSIQQMIQDADKVRAKFGGVEITIHATSPRLLKSGESPMPATPDEMNLMTLCQLFNGQFGPTRGTK